MQEDTEGKSEAFMALQVEFETGNWTLEVKKHVLVQRIRSYLNTRTKAATEETFQEENIDLTDIIQVVGDELFQKMWKDLTYVDIWALAGAMNNKPNKVPDSQDIDDDDDDQHDNVESAWNGDSEDQREF